MFLSGSITALATPFAPSGALDAAAWRRLLEAQLAAGTQAVVVAGSTGEAAALSQDEYGELLSSAVSIVAGRIPVIAGTGQMSTAKTIAQTRWAQALGADVALVVTPPYVRATQTGLVAHYQAVAEEGGLPLLLYNVPARTGTDMAPSAVAALAEHPNIIGIKEALITPDRLQALLALRSQRFAVLGGDDATAVTAMLAGADGLVSVGSNVLPATFRMLCELARSGARAAAESLDAQLREFHAFFSLEPNPIPLKALLQRLGLGAGLRLPLLPLSADFQALAASLAEKVPALESESCRALRTA